LTSDYQRDWPSYFEAVHDKPPRETLRRALAAFEGRGSPGARVLRAIDVACGEGRDTREILRVMPTAHVLALDASEDGLSRLAASLREDDRPRVTLRHLTMEEIPAALAHESDADLVNASFALPFCRPEAFPALWSWITRTLRSGGVFAGQMFGDRDEWAPVRPASHRTRDEVEALLEPFEIIWLDEVEKEGDDACGSVKRHHVFHIVARRRSQA
jgi:SAM-dependent methyltransferase